MKREDTNMCHPEFVTVRPGRRSDGRATRGCDFTINFDDFLAGTESPAKQDKEQMCPNASER